MKKILGFLLGLTVFATVLAGGAFAYLYLRNPEVAPAADIKVIPTPERLARGKYIFEVVADCEGCHSIRDFKRFGGPVVAGKRGVGQVMPEKGLPGDIVVPNITPDVATGIGSWTDGEKIRAIREGISKDGRVLFPMMPYKNFRYMSDEDVYSLVAYLNTLPAVNNPLPKTKVDFPVSMLIKGEPRPAGRVPQPDVRNKLAYGEYLVTMASCQECHTPMEKGQPDLSKRFAGGNVFDFGTVKVVSANITPDVATGIGSWDFERFRERIRWYEDYAKNGSPEVGPDQFTIMPWLNFSRLTDQDLEAIYTYIQTRPAIANSVIRHPGVERASR
jgi:mono/diheme cytochrome c family protein